jgi:hypothetical protein
MSRIAFIESPKGDEHTSIIGADTLPREVAVLSANVKAPLFTNSNVTVLSSAPAPTNLMFEADDGNELVAGQFADVLLKSHVTGAGASAVVTSDVAAGEPFRCALNLATPPAAVLAFKFGAPDGSFAVFSESTSTAIEASHPVALYGTIAIVDTGIISGNAEWDWTPNGVIQDASVDVLVVGGGGGGGASKLTSSSLGGGGGGAGGVLLVRETMQQKTYRVRVGRGGKGSLAGAGEVTGESGLLSRFDGVHIGFGGGAGGDRTDDALFSRGRTGGSGGGAAGNGVNYSPGGSGILGQGNGGGSGNVTMPGGSAGGAYPDPLDTSGQLLQALPGRDLSNLVTGYGDRSFFGGGGSASLNNGGAQLGIVVEVPRGGGGRGGTDQVAGGSGQPHTGGGGGGGPGTLNELAGPYHGGDGGSGVVLIRPAARLMSVSDELVRVMGSTAPPPGLLEGAFRVFETIDPTGNAVRIVEAPLPMRLREPCRLLMDGATSGSLVNTPDGTLAHTYQVATVDPGAAFQATPGDHVSNHVMGGVGELRLTVAEGRAARFETVVELDGVDSDPRTSPHPTLVHLDSRSGEFVGHLGNGVVARQVAVLSARVTPTAARFTEAESRVLYINGLDGTGEGEVTLNPQAWGDDLTLANDFLRMLLGAHFPLAVAPAGASYALLSDVRAGEPLDAVLRFGAPPTNFFVQGMHPGLVVAMGGRPDPAWQIESTAPVENLVILSATPGEQSAENAFDSPTAPLSSQTLYVVFSPDGAPQMEVDLDLQTTRVVTSVDFYRSPNPNLYGRHPSVLKVFSGDGPTGPWALVGEFNELGTPIPDERPDFTRVSTPGTQTRYLRFVLTDPYGGANFQRIQFQEAVVNEVKGYRYPPQGAFSVTTQVGPDGNEEKRLRAALPMQRSGRLQLHLDGGSASNVTNTPDGSLVHTFTVCDLDDGGGAFVYTATEGDDGGDHRASRRRL